MTKLTDTTTRHVRALRQRLWSCCALALAVLVITGDLGCSGSQYLSIRKRPYNPLEQQLSLVPGQGPQPTDRTRQFLRRFDLLKPYEKDPANALQQLHGEIAQEPTAEKIYAFAELAYVQAKKAEGIYKTDEAQDLYGASVAHAYWFLLDPAFDRFRNPYDPQFRRACDLYNNALESSMRIAKKHGKLLPGQNTRIESGKQKFEVSVVCKGSFRAEEIERLEFVSDFGVEGLVNHYHTYGLGVPLIAVRKAPSKLERAEKYYPQGLSFAVTAFLRVLEDPSVTQHSSGEVKHCILELHDPLRASEIEVCNRMVPLETDLSTPLAYYLDSPKLKEQNLATLGLLDTNKAASFKGLYMVEPYNPDKIPVVMVHGLWSSPLTWMEMFNDLRSLPEVRDRYQFWFYLYPTGQPFWTSAVAMRRDLEEVRGTLDPQRDNRALDQMVLVGHSMGGLVSRLQTLQSNEDFWHVVSDRPFSELQATPEERQAIGEVCYFQPNPAVKRVITIGTPHRGSGFANYYTQYASHWLISLPQMMSQVSNSVVRKNPGFFRDTKMLTTKTSIDSLAPDSPIFPVYLAAAKGPGVHYHNIVGEVPHHGVVGYLSRGSDGVVPYNSAHMEDVESEIVVSADHTTVHRHPRAVLEVRRILLAHYTEVLAQWHAEDSQAALAQEPLAPQRDESPTQPASFAAPSFSAPPFAAPPLATPPAVDRSGD